MQIFSTQNFLVTYVVHICLIIMLLTFIYVIWTLLQKKTAEVSGGEVGIYCYIYNFTSANVRPQVRVT